MNSITTDQTIKYTKDLKILYVEDDLNLQAQTKDFFEVLFKSVTVANDGVEALQKYQNEYFDILISDIKMPNMDGLELSKKIKEINPEQCIIIVSAYSDSKYLVTFINLNIRQFIQKPIDMDNMLQTLYYAAKSIVNEKMIEEYRINLEKSNQELAKTNNELNSLVRILDTKLMQIGKHVDMKSLNIDFDLAHIKNQDLLELKELEIDISGASVLINLSKKLEVSNVKILASMFLSYAKILQKYEAYTLLAHHINKIGESLHNAPETFIQRVENISILLESFIYVLRMWRNNIVHKEIRKAMELHSSIINDIETIIAIINGTQNHTQGEMEFF